MERRILDLKFIFLFAWIIPLAIQININETVITTDVSADIQLSNGNHCCCRAQLWIKFSLFYEQFTCESNEDCYMCRSFTIKDLTPKINYILDITFPNKTTHRLTFETKPLKAKLSTKIKWNNVNVSVVQNALQTILICSFKLLVNDKVVEQCSFCKNCFIHHANGLQDDTTYTVEYWNTFMKESSSINFKIDSIPLNISASVGFTIAQILVNSDSLDIKNCSITIRTLEAVVQNFYPPTCKSATLEQLEPGNKYFVDVFMKKSNVGKTISIETDMLKITQNYEQIGFKEIKVTVTASNNIIEQRNCSIEFDNVDVTCKDSCPTDCSNYSILIKNSDSFNVKIVSKQMKYESYLLVVPEVLVFSLKDSYISENLFHIYFQPNIKNAGKCIVKAYVNNEETTLVCKEIPCPTNCDQLNFILKDIPYYKEITFIIQNDFLSMDQSFSVIPSPEIIVNRTVKTSAVSAMIEVTTRESEVCCCEGSLIKYYSLFYIFYNCNDDNDCIHCRSFNLINLTPNTWYTLYHKLPNNTVVDLTFKTEYAEATVNLTADYLSISVSVETVDNVGNKDCAFKLFVGSEEIDSCNYDCSSCYNHSFTNLIVETVYKVIYKNTYLRDPITKNITTAPSKMTYEIVVNKNFHTIQLEIKSELKYRGLCNAVVRDIHGNDIDTHCSFDDNCKYCNQISLYNLVPGDMYEIKITFINHKVSKLINVTTDFITLSQKAEQVGIYRYMVQVEVTTSSYDIYHCSVTFNTSLASCENSCPTNCSNYIVILKSQVSFTATLSSKEAVQNSVITAKPQSYKIALNTSTIKGKYVMFTFYSNFFNGGNCFVEFWIKTLQIIPQCTDYYCSQNCDSLTLNVSNLYKFTKVDIIVKSDGLSTPYFTSVDLDFGVILDKVTNITTKSASFDILHGGSSRCNGTLFVKNTYKTVYVSCESNEDCVSCKSFTIDNLLPYTNYQFEYQVEMKEKSILNFQTEPVDPLMQIKVSFSHARIILNENNSKNTKLCMFEVLVQNNVVHSCIDNCSSCGSLLITQLTFNENYRVTYHNEFMNRTITASFTTVTPTHKLPRVIYTSQKVHNKITFTIDNITLYSYKGYYRVYITNISNNKPIYSLISSGNFSRHISEIEFEILDSNSHYRGMFCFKVEDNICLQNPELYTCLQCQYTEFSVCSVENFYPTIGNWAVNELKGEMSLSYDNSSLQCHNDIVCVFGFKYLLRKKVFKYSIDIDSNDFSKKLSSHFLVAYPMLNRNDCIKNSNFTIYDIQLNNKVNQIRKTEVYITSVIAVCDLKRCVTTEYMKQFNIPPPRMTDLAIFIIFTTISVLLWLGSVILLSVYGLNVDISQLEDNVNMADEFSGADPSKQDIFARLSMPDAQVIRKPSLIREGSIGDDTKDYP